MLVLPDLRRDRVSWQLLEHHADIDQTVGAAVHEHDRRADIAGRELGDFVVLRPLREGEGDTDFVVVHLEGAVADDLEPVHDAFRGGEGVQVRVGGEFLVGGDVVHAPVEEEGEGFVDAPGEDCGVQEGGPHGGAAEDGAAAEEEEEDLWVCFDERGDDSGGQARGGHGRGEGDEDVDFAVQGRVDGEGGEGLRGALREADVGEGGLVGGGEDVVDAVRDVVEGELVHAEVPEGGLGGGVVGAFLAVLVAAVVAQPDVVALVYEQQGEAAFFLRQAHPHFAVHQQAVVEVDDFLLHRSRSGVDSHILFALPVCEAVEA